jgi:hypothetical protein
LAKSEINGTLFFMTEQAAGDAGEKAEECASEPLRAQPGRRV